jgi:hypothetical protein
MAVAALRFRPDSNTATPLETKSGSYIYDGSISAFHEWDFRTQMRIAGASDDSEKRRAVNKVVEGLRGDAFDLAMDIGLARLMEDGGLTDLIALIRKTIFPIEAQEAKVLFALGQKPYGPMTRQSNESMVSYASRRRRWWNMVTKLDSKMVLSDEMLGSLLLDHSGLSSHEGLMVLTSTGNVTAFDKVRDVLILQHSRIHLTKSGHEAKGKENRVGGKKANYMANPMAEKVSTGT